MTYIVSGQDEIAGAPVAREADNVDEALDGARLMLKRGFVNVRIDDNRGNEIGGDALAACVEGEMILLPDLQAR